MCAVVGGGDGFSTSVLSPLHGGDGGDGPVLTWVLHRVDGHFVVGFAGAQASHHVLDPPQLLPQLSFLLLHTAKCTEEEA